MWKEGTRLTAFSLPIPYPERKDRKGGLVGWFVIDRALSLVAKAKNTGSVNCQKGPNEVAITILHRRKLSQRERQ